MKEEFRTSIEQLATSLEHQKASGIGKMQMYNNDNINPVGINDFVNS
jgi:hypothetical protein